MLNRIGHIVLSFWLSLLLIFGSTTKEFVHLFTGHEDTVHCIDNDGELSFEKEHHHCTFLSFALTDFYHHTPAVDIPYIPQEHHVTVAVIPSFISGKDPGRILLRGPPAIS